jgi:hypothetical protein
LPVSIFFLLPDIGNQGFPKPRAQWKFQLNRHASPKTSGYLNNGYSRVSVVIHSHREAIHTSFPSAEDVQCANQQYQSGFRAMELFRVRVRTPYLFDIPGPGAIRTLLKLLSILLAATPWDHCSRLFECKPGSRAEASIECRDLLDVLALLNRVRHGL